MLFAAQDVVILAKACLRFRDTMMGEFDWCPFTNSLTLAAFTLFVLRADYLDNKKMGCFPEQGYGSPGASRSGIAWLKWVSKERGIMIRHGDTAFGEEVSLSDDPATLFLDCADKGTRLSGGWRLDTRGRSNGDFRIHGMPLAWLVSDKNEENHYFRMLEMFP